MTASGTAGGLVILTSPVARSFAGLLFAAVESPAAVDRSALLSAANGFLDRALLEAAQGDSGDPEGLAAARRMACLAADWAIWGRPEDYRKLASAVDMFGMRTHIIHRLSGVDRT
jgi:hypothetical protein